MLDVFKIYLPDSKKPSLFVGNFEDACVKIKGKPGAIVSDLRGKVLARYNGPSSNGHGNYKKPSYRRSNHSRGTQ